MEVRRDILKKLLCSVCGEYLSCTPVRMKNNEAVVCGRCCDPEGEPTLRITPYEYLAEMMLFPCVNKTHGCTETLYMAEMKDHEEECEYKQYVCPVTELEQCDWSGSRKNILSHCKEQHPDKLLQNPDTITHQINKTNHKTFLLAAFQMLFIIHCKVCTVSKNIYHSVRLIGTSVFASRYRYELEMSNSDEDTLTRKMDVAPQGCMSLQEDISVPVDFNTMLRFLDFKDVIFKIRVGRKCVKCKKCAVESAWPTYKGWCCKDCAPATRQCKFTSNGCFYTDINSKVNKHEVFYCKFSTWCTACKKNVHGSRQQHYLSVHSHITYKAGAIRRAPVVNERKLFIITSGVGKLWCDYVLNDKQFELHIWSPLHTVQLADYKCTVKIGNPSAGYILRQTLPMYYDVFVDWELCMQKEEFLMYVNNNEFDIVIKLIKI